MGKMEAVVLSFCLNSQKKTVVIRAWWGACWIKAIGSVEENSLTTKARQWEKAIGGEFRQEGRNFVGHLNEKGGDVNHICQTVAAIEKLRRWCTMYWIIDQYLKNGVLVPKRRI